MLLLFPEKMFCFISSLMSRSLFFPVTIDWFMYRKVVSGYQ